MHAVVSGLEQPAVAQPAAIGVAWLLACLMVLAAALGVWIRLSPADHEPRAPFSLDQVVPRQFADWREKPLALAEVINPQTRQLVNKIYSQTLTRVYENSRGQRVMLSLAYGGDQRGEMRAHKPEVCYPAQGFELRSNEKALIRTPWGAIKARQLETRLGPRREPVTYWFTMGNQAVANLLEQRLVELRLALTGQVPDGLLFRVSSVDPDAPRAFLLQQDFVSALLGAVSPEARIRLAGLVSEAGGLAFQGAVSQ